MTAKACGTYFLYLEWWDPLWCETETGPLLHSLAALPLCQLNTCWPGVKLQSYEQMFSVDPIICSMVSGTEHVDRQTRTECKAPALRMLCTQGLFVCEFNTVCGNMYDRISYHRFWPPNFGNTEMELYAIKCICNSHTEYSADNVYHVLVNKHTRAGLI